MLKLSLTNWNEICGAATILHSQCQTTTKLASETEMFSLSPSGCVSLRWGVSLTGSSSPVVSILYVHWCEVQADEVMWDGVYPSLPLPSLIPTSIHFSFEDTLDAVVIFSSLDMSVPSQSWLTYLVCNATEDANVIISFLVLQCDTKTEMFTIRQIGLWLPWMNSTVLLWSWTFRFWKVLDLLTDRQTDRQSPKFDSL